MQAASRNDLEGLLQVVERAGESFDGQAVEAALHQVGCNLVAVVAHLGGLRRVLHG